jgi:hypothetical protein
VGDELEHEIVDARNTRGRILGQSRELPAIAAGKVATGGPNLLLDDVVVVDEPLGCGGNATAATHGFREQCVRFAQGALVGVEAGKKPVWCEIARRAEIVPAGQGMGVLLELTDGIEFGS